MSLFKLDLLWQCSTCPAALKLRSTELHVVGTVRGKLAPSTYLAQTANSQLSQIVAYQLLPPSFPNWSLLDHTGRLSLLVDFPNHA